MPTYKVTTRSGAVYVIDTDSRFWSHAPRDGRVDTRESLSLFKMNTVDNPDQPPWLPDSQQWESAGEPIVGKWMYLRGGISGGVWRLSTPIESVEIIDSRDEEAM